MSKSLLSAIREKNDAAVAWSAGGPGRMVGLLTENLEHWKAMGVTDADTFDAYLDSESYSNLFKGAYGMRPPAELHSAFLAAPAYERQNILEDLSRLNRSFEEDDEFDSLEEG